MGDNIKLTGATVDVNIGVDVANSTTGFNNGLQKLAEKAAAGSIPKITIRVDKIDASKALNDFKGQLQTIANNMGLKLAAANAANNSGNTTSNTNKSNSVDSFQERKGNALYNLENRLKKASVSSATLRGNISDLRKELNKIKPDGMDDWLAKFKAIRRDVDNFFNRQKTVSRTSKSLDMLVGHEANYTSGKYSKSAELTMLYEQANKLKAAFAGIDPIKWDIEKAKQFNVIVGEICSKMSMTSKMDGAENWSKQQIINYQNLTAQAEKYFATHGKIRSNKEISGQVDDFMLRLRDTAFASDKDAVMQFNQLRQVIRDAGLETETLGQQFKRLFGSHLGLAVIMAGVQLLRQGLHAVAQDILSIDKAMTELKKVTSASDSTYRSFMERGAANAKKYGSSVADMLNSSADFARLGYTLDQSAELAKTANVYKNVGDGIKDVGTASESIISTMKAFGIEAKNSMSIVDKFNQVGNNFAISSAGIGEAMRRSAAALAAGGNTLDQSIAMAVAANSVIQDPERVGTALKTLSLRLRGAKVDLESMGESTDGMADSVAILREKLLALTGQKVDIMLDDSTFKSTYQIMLEMSQVWGDMTDINQAAALELMGGKHQANVLASMLKDMGTAEQALVSSLDSSGSAMKENEAALDSITGKADKFKATLESLAMHTVDSSAVKGFLDIITGIVEALDQLSQTKMGLPALIASFTTFLNLKGVGGGIINPFTLITKEIGKADKTLGIFNQTFSSFSKQVRNAKGWGKVGAALGLTRTVPVTPEADAVAFFDKYEEASKRGADAAKEFIAVHAPADIKHYFSTVDAGTGTMAGYKASVQGVQTVQVATKASTLALKAGQIALNAAYTMGLSLLIQFAVEGLMTVINAEKDAAQAAEELRQKWQENSAATREAEAVLTSVSQRYAELSKGVDNLGANTSLTTEEYKEYNQITSEIADNIPGLIAGYTKEGHAILKHKGDVEKLTEAMQNLKNERNKETQNKAKELYEDFHKQADKEYSPFSQKIGLKQQKEALDMLLAIEDKVAALSRDLQDLESVMKDMSIKGFMDFLDVDQAYDHFIKNKDNFYSQLSVLDQKYADAAQNALAVMMPEMELNQNFQGMAADLQTQLSTYSTYFRGLDTDFILGLGDSTKLQEYVNSIVNQISGNDAAKFAFSDLVKLDADKMPFDKYVKEMDRIKAVLGEIDGFNITAFENIFDFKGLDSVKGFLDRLKREVPELKQGLLDAFSPNQLKSLQQAYNGLSAAMGNDANPNAAMTESLAKLIESGDMTALGNLQVFTQLVTDAEFSSAGIRKLHKEFDKLGWKNAEKELNHLREFTNLAGRLKLEPQQMESLYKTYTDTGTRDKIADYETQFRRGKISADEFNGSVRVVIESLLKAANLPIDEGFVESKEALADFYDSTGAAHEAATGRLEESTKKIKELMDQALANGDYEAFIALKAQADAASAAVQRVTTALQDFQNASKVDESPNYTALQEAYNVIAEALKTGETNTKKFHEATNALFGEDYELDVSKLKKTMEKLKPLFGEKATSEKIEQAFMKSFKSGAVEYWKNASGEDIGLKIPDIDRLAEEWKKTLGQKLSPEAMMGLLEEVDLQLPIKWDEIKTNDEELKAMFQKKWTELQAEIESTPTEPITKEVPVEITPVEGTTTKETTPTKEIADATDGLADSSNNAASALSVLSGKIEIVATESGDAQGVCKSLNTSLDTLAAKQIGDLGLTIAKTKAAAVYDELVKIQNITFPDKTINVKYNVTGEPTGGTGGGTGKGGTGSGNGRGGRSFGGGGEIRGFAKGTVSARSGVAMLGEQGPELVKRGSKSFFAGLKGPQLFPLKAGDRVYTTQETFSLFGQKAIVSSSRDGFRMLQGMSKSTPYDFTIGGGVKINMSSSTVKNYNLPSLSKRKHGKVSSGGSGKGKGGSSGAASQNDYAERAAQDEKDRQEELKRQMEELREQQKKAMQRAFSDLEYNHDMGLTADKDYYKRLSEMANQYYSQGLMELDEYQDKRLKILNGLKKIEEDALKKQTDKYKSAHSAVDKALSKEIDRLKKERDALMDEDVEGSYGARIKALQDELETMQATNDETARAIELGRVKEALERARTQRKSLVYREGQGFVYISNQQELDEAQAAYDKTMYDSLVAQKDKEIKQLEKDAKAQAEIFDKKIEQISEYQDKWKEAVDSYETEQNRLNAAQLLGAEWEADILNGRLDKMKTFVEDYAKIQAQLAKLQEETLSSFEKTQLANGAITPSLPAQPPAPPATAYPMSPYAQSPSYDYSGGYSSGYDDSFGGAGLFSGTLRKGSKGSEVAALQSALLSMGYKIGSKGADGVFGASTQAALKKYQRANGLKADGVFGSKTQAKFGGSRYAEGTRNAAGGLSLVDDGTGKELVIRKPLKGRHTFLEAGSVVYSAEKTKNLWAWGDLAPAEFMRRLAANTIRAGAVSTRSDAINIRQGDLIIKGNVDEGLLPKIRTEIERSNANLAHQLFQTSYRRK